MSIHKTSRLIMAMVAVLLAACNKGNDNYLFNERILPVTVKGYNATTEELAMKLDTFSAGGTLGKQAAFERSEAYRFRGGKQAVMLSISEKSTGKLVLEKELRKDDAPVYLNFLYMDGKVSDMPEKPAVVDEKISLIYMFVPDITKYDGPVDFVIGKYFLTPKVFEEVARIKNVKPNEFSEPATFSTFSTARQEYNGVMTSVLFHVRIYKAGTNTPYTEGTAYGWNELNSTAPKPSASAPSSKLYIISEAPTGNYMRFFTRLDY